jgi:hypothetical protein
MHQKSVFRITGFRMKNPGFSGKTFFRSVLSLSYVIIFEIYTKMDILIPDMTHVEKTNFGPPIKSSTARGFLT